MAKSNGIATANDFRKLAEDSAFEEPSRVVLPKSGLGWCCGGPPNSIGHCAAVSGRASYGKNWIWSAWV